MITAGIRARSSPCHGMGDDQSVQHGVAAVGDYHLVRARQQQLVISERAEGRGDGATDGADGLVDVCEGRHPHFKVTNFNQV